MKRLQCKIAKGLIMLFILSGCETMSHDLDKTSSGEYWRKQALDDIIPYWTKYARDTVFGAFCTNLDAVWGYHEDTRKYPSMISRHIFSYSVAYLLSGDEKYLNIARETKDFLIDHAWDKEYGGWFDVLDEQGNPLEKTKSLFIQAYAITGLTMYYLVTHDHDVFRYIEQSNTSLETKAWDVINGGYFNRMTREWEVLDERKILASQLAPVSGYLLYLSLCAGDKKYLDQAAKIMNVVCSHAFCSESGWATETFDRNWNDASGELEKINIGHNLEIAWILMRLRLLANDPSDEPIAEALGQNLRQYGFSEETGIWFTNIKKEDPGAHDDFTYWWVQAYGNMYNLCSFRTSGKEVSLSDFEKGARFWDSYFIDRKNGDTFFSVLQSGEIKDSIKANPFKASYHSMEHCLLNFAYLHLWVNREPVELHFLVNTKVHGDTLYPLFMEDRSIKINQAFYYENTDKIPLKITGQQSILLPGSKRLRITVILGH